MQNKLLTMLGFAQKSGNLYSGENTVEMFMPKKKISLIIITEDASENTRDKFISLSNKLNIPYILFGNKELLSQAIGKFNRAVLGVANKKFSREIKRLYDEINESDNRVNQE